MQLALESPQEREPQPGVVQLVEPSPNTPVRFRGPVVVQGLDGLPGEERTVVVRLVYPADATPPQVLSLLSADTLAPEPHAGDPRHVDVDALIAPLLDGS